tara:strand:+ start:187 stop:444 length:258 start_codon:yes stop_codon:yes gene_type:complete
MKMKSNILKPISAENKFLFNKAVAWLIKHNNFNDLRDKIDGEFGEDCKEWRAINRKCESSFDKFETYLDELPEREQKVILKSNLY